MVWFCFSFYSMSPPRGASSLFQQPCLSQGLRGSACPCVPAPTTPPLLSSYNPPHCTGASRASDLSQLERQSGIFFLVVLFFLMCSSCYRQAESARGCWWDLVGWEMILNSTLFFPLRHALLTVDAAVQVVRSSALLLPLFFRWMLFPQ